MDAPPECRKILSAEAVCDGGGGSTALRDVNVRIEENTLNLFFGEPGCGKNRLLRLLGLLEPPNQGEILYRDTPTRALSEEERAGLRNRHFGFLFAEPYLLPSFSVVENVAMPFLRNAAADSDAALTRTRTLLDFVGLADREQLAVAELSRAEQQRVSLARALINQPEIVMVEAIDGGSEGVALLEFCGTLRRAAEEFAATIIVTASSGALAGAMDHSFELARGVLRPLAGYRQGGGVRA